MKERILERIFRKGLITFEDFLEIVLYDEKEGYYRAGKQEGQDYYTSPEIHPIFGRTIGRYIEGICDCLGATSPSILELGGASGRLASAIMSGFDHVSPERYVIFDRVKERTEGLVQKINCLDCVNEGGGFSFVIANEFFDAIPFHRITSRDGVMREIYVGHGHGFFEETGPLSDSLRLFLERYPVFLQDGQVSEVTTYGLPVIERVSTMAETACFLVFDYGYHQTEIAAGRFFDGSLLGYRSLQIRDDVFEDLGLTDITHHVNFDHLSAMLAENGWRKDGEVDQWRFLQRAGMLELLAGLPENERLAAKWLIDPGGLGSMISVLGFSKGLPFPMPGF